MLILIFVQHLLNFMKSTTISFLLLSFILISCKKTSKADINEIEKETKISTKSDNVSILKKEFVIKGLNDISHKVWLYLPPDYSSSNKNYPVIYMHDAQNLFDNATSYLGEWSVDETLNDYYSKNKRGFIVVAVENGGAKRIEEYTPWKHQKYGGGKGGIYVDFLVNELKPYLDQNYRTKKDANSTAIIGSSLGGLISFYGGLKHPNVFGKIGALSTSFWFSEKIIDFAKENGSLQDTKLYLLVGGQEGDSMVPDTENMQQLLLETGFNPKNLRTKIVPEGKHNEAFWKSEFLEVITYLFE